MKRYYCLNCKSEIISAMDTIPTNMCPICQHCILVKTVEWETPEQYKERTGNEYIGPVWYRPFKLHEWYITVNYYEAVYLLNKYHLLDVKTYEFICACTHWGEPPIDWRSENK